jgi:hypothetical protein
MHRVSYTNAIGLSEYSLTAADSIDGLGLSNGFHSESVYELANWLLHLQRLLQAKERSGRRFLQVHSAREC